MKLQTATHLPSDLPQLVRRLNDLLVQAAIQVNGLSEGTLAATYNAQTSAPTTGTYAQGDFVRNSAPTEAGIATAKYVIYGWICTVSGTPGTWLDVRTLTGN